ncbi:MAG: hypothetical protein K2N84_01595 [Clostridia bacterium]|nr:hypothetical protein [Clostridia bacterium]
MLNIENKFLLKKNLSAENKRLVADIQNEWGKQNHGVLHFQEIALRELLKAYPGNKNYDEVLTKCAFINDMFSTHVYNEELKEIATKISSYAEFDGKLSDGKQNELITMISKNERGILLSFATKYCAVHQEKRFPIYDSLVVNALCYYQKEDNFYTKGFAKKGLKDYGKYMTVYDAFISYYGLTDCSYREVDKYLWTIVKMSSNKQT